jgi:hypothetical protein
MTSSAPDVTLLPDGFRRTAPPADPVRWSALRQRLSQAASGQGRALQDGLALFRSWEIAGEVLPMVLPPVALRGGEASRRALQRFLRTLGARRATVGELQAVPRGTPTRVVGKVTGPSRKPFSHIWSKSEMSEDNVRLLVEEGHDFFLEDAPGQVAVVRAAGGYLIGGPDGAIDGGAEVEVFGFVDHVIDSAAPPTGRLPRGEPIVLALRAGDELPLVVRKILRPPLPKMPDPPKNDRERE